jgi:hypothetical protein
MMPEDYRKSLLKNIPDQKEKDMEIPKKESTPPATPEERISALEKKVRDQDALIKGLTEEFLDLKSITMRLNKVNEERRGELKMARPPATGGGAGTVVVTKRTVPATGGRMVPQAPEPEKLDMIMQPDGMLKPEKRKSGDFIVASASYSKKGKQQSQGAGKKNDLIVAEEEETEVPKK